MKRGECMTIQRLSSGLYAISREDQPTLVGGAASTAANLVTLVFQTEAGETVEYLAPRRTRQEKLTGLKSR